MKTLSAASRADRNCCAADRGFFSGHACRERSVPARNAARHRGRGHQATDLRLGRRRRRGLLPPAGASRHGGIQARDRQHPGIDHPGTVVHRGSSAELGEHAVRGCGVQHLRVHELRISLAEEPHARQHRVHQGVQHRSRRPLRTHRGPERRRTDARGFRYGRRQQRDGCQRQPGRQQFAELPRRVRVPSREQRLAAGGLYQGPLERVGAVSE